MISVDISYIECHMAIGATFYLAGESLERREKLGTKIECIDPSR